jgi:exosome complex component RRP42
MNVQKEYLKNLLSKGKRIDGRGLLDFRKIEIQKGVIAKAEGSARVRIGDTEVIAGVKMDVGAPFSDKPDEGVMMVNSELSPMASPDFETGPPREESIELSRVVDRGIRESKAIDTKKLCIEAGEKVWMVFVDIYIINHQGNLIDASALASIAALEDAKMPEYDGNRVNNDKKTKKLPLTAKPIEVTVIKIGETFIVDPTLEEEKVAQARITIATRDNENLCALQKGGTSLTEDEIYKAFDISIKKGKELRKLL